MPVGRKIKSEVFSYDGFGWKTPGWVTETEGAGVWMGGAGDRGPLHAQGFFGGGEQSPLATR